MFFLGPFGPQFGLKIRVSGLSVSPNFISLISIYIRGVILTNLKRYCNWIFTAAQISGGDNLFYFVFRSGFNVHKNASNFRLGSNVANKIFPADERSSGLDMTLVQVA